MNVTALYQPQAAVMETPAAPTAAQAVNALWLRLDQARNVALCIPDRCEILGAEGPAAAALAQVFALSGAVAELLALALKDAQALEALV